MVITIRQLGFALAVALSGVSAWAIDFSMTEQSGLSSYEKGLAAYFHGSSDAEDWLSLAIEDAPSDPRPLYFRGLALLRQGRCDEARGDFIVAAALESASRGAYPVGKSLERVQGCDRLELETFRRHGRIDSIAARGDEAHTYTEHRAHTAIFRDDEVLRQPVHIPLERLVEHASLPDVVDRPADAVLPHPLDESTILPAPATVAPPVPAETEPAAGAPSAAASPADPFSDDSQPTAPASAEKIPSSKLIGIVGRAISEAAPVPLIESVREQLPDTILPGAAPTADPAVNSAAPGDATEIGAANESDPFSEPPASTPPAPTEQPATSPPATEDEDPFGG